MKIYVSEPAGIDLKYLRGILNNDEMILSGNTSFSTNHEDDVSAILIKSKTKIDSSILHIFPKLRHVIRAGTGIDNIDQEFCAKHGIKIYNAPGANSESVADMTIMALLMSLRNIQLLTRQKVLTWNRSGLQGKDLSSTKVGVIGYGNIGKIVTQRLICMGARNIKLYDPFISGKKLLPDRVMFTELDILLSDSDVITLHLPLNDKTNYIIDEAQIALFNVNAILLNMSRGGLVNEKALLKACDEKNIIYFADSVENEPNINPELLKNKNVFITPHIAGYTTQSIEKSIELALNNFRKGISLN